MMTYKVGDFSENEPRIPILTQHPESVVFYPAVCGPLAYAEECLKLLTVDSVFAFRIGE